MTDFQSIELSEEVDFDAVDALFGCEATEELDFASMVEGAGGAAKTLLRIEDRYGWDDVVLLPNGKILMDDRNSGFVSYTNDAPADAADFIKKLVALLTD